MRVLLDTHILLWCLEGDSRLPIRAVDLVEVADEVYASTASLWEMAIKHSLGKLRLDIDFSDLPKVIADSGFEILPVNTEHTVQLAHLPSLHRDPFDRMLVSQSIVEPLRLVTHDSVLADYGNTVILV